MRTRAALGGFVLAAALLLGAAAPAGASSSSVDSAASVAAEPSTKDLCMWFRPYGAGDLLDWDTISSHEKRCLVMYVDEQDGFLYFSCYRYYVRWWGGWNGPFDVTEVPCFIVG